jgi:1-acyl-sn-glycerol-3-phosphate acyltransferase
VTSTRPPLPLANALAWVAWFVAFQAAWFGTALLAHNHPARAAVPMIAFVALHLWLGSRARMATLSLCAGAAVLGLAVDSALRVQGATSFAAPGVAWWMVALWAGFACTLETTLANVARRPAVALVLGAVGGPLAYRGGAALDALHVHGVAGLVAIGVLWAVALPLLGALASVLAIERFARRARTLPRLALMVLVLGALAPVWLALAFVVDVVRGNRARASVRVVAFGAVFVCVESWVLLLTAWDTLTLRGDALLAATLMRQQQFTRALLTGVERVFRVRVVVENDACAAPGPVIVLARHASIVDTLLPSVVVTQGHGVKLRFVLKRELLEDPCLDVAGTRLPNVFVSRSPARSAADLVAIEELARNLGERDGVLIYPEGTRFTVAKRQAAAAQGSTLRHVLPAKPGGTLAALRGAPDADVVLMAHRGLDGFAKVADIWSGALLDRTVRVTLRRVPRALIPLDDDARARWLAEQWQKLDHDVEALA